MAFGIGRRQDRPPRALAARTSVLDQHQDFVKMRNIVINGKLGVREVVWATFSRDDAKKYGRKNIARVAREQMVKTLRDLRLDSDYAVKLYKTDMPTEGSWCLSVEFDPPMTKDKTGTPVERRSKEKEPA